jgi:hypothetical protein
MQHPPPTQRPAPHPQSPGHDSQVSPESHCPLPQYACPTQWPSWHFCPVWQRPQSSVSPQPFGTFPHSVRKSAHVLHPPSAVPPVPELPPWPEPPEPTVDVVPPSASGPSAENSLPEQAPAAATRHTAAHRKARTHLIPSTPKIQGYHEFGGSAEGWARHEKLKELRVFGHRVKRASAMTVGGIFQARAIRDVQVSTPGWDS